MKVHTDMKKKIIDLRITCHEEVGAGCVLIKAVPMEGRLPECLPGQFAQLRVDAPNVFLRRPISIHDVEDDEISFLVQVVGDGTRWLGDLKRGDTLNAVLPLGRGFAMPNAECQMSNVLLIGGGVGVAPLLFLGKVLRARGVCPTFLLGARTRGQLLRLDAFRQVGDVLVTTEDGSMGARGFVTQHPMLAEMPGGRDDDSPAASRSFRFSDFFVCGPGPMMRAVAKLARERGIPCQVSLENRMACGVGACLCCVEETTTGNRCTCTDGPVFDIDELKW